jgi:hypothetical protein
MKQRQEEGEVIARLDLLEGVAHITVHAWTAMANKMERLYGPPKDGDSQQSRRWAVPLKAVSFRKIAAGSRKPMSEERKQAIAARFAASRAEAAQKAA